MSQGVTYTRKAEKQQRKTQPFPEIKKSDETDFSVSSEI
ncbi:hypothetical protein M087_1938 [Bacteroides fragilis str. S23 R14]|nr:hypothetical protein M087_1938 [Bacteroides fragilis str. S23 R14]EYA66645.1 hypothetical protein M139_2091 [Bacteroides fragilis str. S23L24]